MIGRTLSHFRIVDRLGAGGMGVVYRAHDQQLDREVAIKVLPSASLGDPSARARLLREARTAPKLNHPNICTIYEVGEDEGQAFIAMELIEGRPLSALLESGALPAEQVQRYGLQLADALAHAHERGIIHRDLKSANVMITDGRAKLLDFGLAKPQLASELVETAARGVETVTAPGMVAGTLAYMAPEQLRGRHADGRSDVWALGVVLYEMATGIRPFGGSTTFELTSAILSQPRPPLPAGPMDSLPPGLVTVIDRCLEKDPDSRYQQSSDVRAALEAVQSGAAVPRFIPGRRRMPRGFRLTLAAAFAAIVVIAGAVMTGLNLEGVRERLLRGAASTRVRSLAVLPLENLSGDAAQDYFADGMTEALITDLSKLKALRVTARRSVMRFKGTAQALPEIARALGVQTLLTGSVIREASRASIRAQLYDAASNQQVWADRYERELSSVLSLQNEVARAVAAKIQVRLRPEEQSRLDSARPVNAGAYEAYLRGMSHLNKGTAQEIKQGLTYFQEAVDTDPADPLANAGLALAYVEQAHSAEARQDSLAKAKAAAATALRLDGTLAEVLAARAMVEGYLEWNWDAAFQDYDRALDINPSLASAYYHRAWLHMLFGHMGQAEQDQLRAWELDPFNQEVMAHVGALYAYKGELEKATAHGLKAVEMAPKSPLCHGFLAETYSLRRMYDEAIAAARKAADLSPNWRWQIAKIYADAGRREEARALLAELNKNPLTPFGAMGRSEVCIALGDMDEAFRWMAYEPHHAWVPWNTVKPGLASLRKDPRFPELLRRWHLPPVPAAGSR